MESELLRWIDDTDAVSIILGMLDFGKCFACRKRKGSKICASCGETACKKCRRTWRRQVSKIMDSCGSCNDTFCEECFLHCAGCNVTKCCMDDELCSMGDWKVWNALMECTECTTCGKMNCEQCTGECHACNAPTCASCLESDRNMCEDCEESR